MLNRIAISLLALVLSGTGAFSQIINTATKPLPITIATGLTFQQVLPALVGNDQRRSLTIQNNNASDSCNLLVGGPWLVGDTTATTRTPTGGTLISAAKGSIVLLPGGSYTRYTPYIPSDQILATCTTAGDSLYVDTQ